MRFLIIFILCLKLVMTSQKMTREEYYKLLNSSPEEKRQPGVIVDIPGLGTVNGTQGISVLVPSPPRRLYSFYGIPYGQDTSGPNRFMPSKPAEAWEHVLDVTKPNSDDSCPHNGILFGFKGTEDCLKVYVFTPKLPGQIGFKPMPVMVWFHGGQFTMGDFNIYRGNRLIHEADIVLVTVHYRLGVLGFMSTQTEDAPGNAGLYDMFLSLQWVQKYISAFGGDPSQVVISGESAGAASSSHLMMFDGAKDLFHGVILQSGTALDAWAIDHTPLESALRYGGSYHDCNYTPQQIPEFVECMRAVPYEDLIKKWGSFVDEQRYEGSLGFSGATPVIQQAGEPKIISENPVTKLREGRFHNVPVFIGNNKHEGSFALAVIYGGYVSPHNLENDAAFWRNDAFYLILQVDYKHDVTGFIERTLIDQYMNGLYPVDMTEANPRCIDMLGAMFFKGSAHTVAETVAQYGGTAYVYSFEYEGYSNFDMFFGDIPVYGGVTHSDELMYLFTLWPPFFEDNRLMSKKMVTMWTNFVIHLDPTKGGDETLGIPRLDPYSGDRRTYLEINLDVRVKPDYLATFRPCMGQSGNENNCVVT